MRRLRMLAVLLMAGLFASCNPDAGPTGVPAIDPSFSHGGSSDTRGIDRDTSPPAWAFGELARFKRTPVEPAVVTETIGPKGGSIQLGEFEVVVPAGAVSRKTEFVIRRPVDRWQRQFVVVELKPHNVTFAVPVTIRFPLKGTTVDGRHAEIVSWDGSGWDGVPTRVIEHGERVEARVRHFSIWGVRSTRYAEISSGG